MATASVSELKTSLSDYLDQVKAGGEIIVTERGRAIARVVPYIRAGAGPAVPTELAVPVELEKMIRAGIIWPARRKPTPTSLRPPRASDPGGAVRAALLKEREEGW